MKRIFLATLLYSFLFAAEIITNTIPALSTSVFQTQLHPSQMFKGQKFEFKFPFNIGYYSNKVLNEAQLTEHQIDCKWSQSLYNYTNVAITKSLNLTEEERIITAGMLAEHSYYYVVTSQKRLFKMQTEMSTRSLRVLKEIPLAQNVRADAQFVNYKDSLVLQSNNTILMIQDEQISYISMTDTHPIIKILAIDDYLYYLTLKNLRRWRSGVAQDIPLGEVQSLVDMDYRKDGKIFVLDSKRSIFVITNGTSKQYSFHINQGLFTKIRVSGKIIQCVYTIQKSNFLVELYDIEDKLSINKIYPINAHINNIVMFDYYAILIHDYHISLVLHSASRHIETLEYSQMINSMLIVGVTQINKLENEMVLVVKDYEVFLSREISVQPPQLICEFEKSGVYTINIEYQLPHCSANSSQQQSILNGYCSKQFQKTITVKEGKKLRIVLFVYIISATVLLLIIGIMIGGIIYCLKEFKQYENKLKLMQKKRMEEKANIQKDTIESSDNVEVNKDINNVNVLINSTTHPMGEKQENE